MAERLVERLLQQHRCEVVQLNLRNGNKNREAGTDIESLKKTLTEHNDWL